MTCVRDGRGRWAALVLIWGGALAAQADEAPAPAAFPGESKATAARLAEARKLIDAKKWPEAVEELQAVVAASGDDLVPLTPERSVQCRRLCDFYLAGLPADALRLYRDRVDPQSRKWLEQAALSRDVPLLRRVVDEAFCSRPGEKAIDLLGDLAFERGDFAEAEHWWKLLLPPPAPAKADAPRAFNLTFPDPQIDPARTRAKVLLARLYRGAPHGAEDLAAYRKQYATAEGAFAGRKGKYAEALEQVAADLKGDEPADDSWPTFAGDAARGRTAPAPPRLLERLGALCRPQNERRFSLEERKPLDEDPDPGKPATASVRNRSMAFEPIVVDGKVVVADARYVTAFDPRTGAAEKWYDAADKNGGFNPDLKLPARPDLRYTLTASGGRLFARLGVQPIQDFRPKEKDGARDDESLVACLSLKPGPDGDRGLWVLRAAAPESVDKDKSTSLFEGTPLVHDGLLYVAATRFETGRAVTRVHCYPADAREAPRERWRRDVCETREFADKEQRFRHHLLTLAGPYLAYCSHSGAVVALDAVTGRPVWAARYPSRGDKTADDAPSPRGLAPCLFADGRLYVAPADCDRLLCLDPVTGETLWQRDRIETVHLLGVGQDKLIFTTPTGLRAVGADDGVDAWALPDGGSLAPIGRGLLIGDLVLWPTDRGVYAVRQADGAQPDDPTLLGNIPPGNLVYAGGCLASAGRQKLSIFVPPALRLEEREREGAAGPQAALDLARAEADAGLTDRALETYATAERLGAALSAPKQRRLRATVRKERHALLLAAGRGAAAAKHGDEAEGLFRRAADAEFPAPLRLQALLESAALAKTAGRNERAAAVWQGIRNADDLRGLIVEDGAGIPQRAAAFAADRLAAPRKPDGDSPRQATAGAAPQPPPQPPFLRSWQAALESGEAALLLSDDLVLCGRDQPAGRLTCRSTDTGKVRWRTDLSFAPTWAGRLAGVVVTAGAAGAAGLRQEDGRILWEFAAPPPSATFPDEAGTVLTADGRRPDPLASFHLLGNRLCFMQGEHRLFALDAETGRVLWSRKATGAGLRQPAPYGRFWHVFPVNADALLIQTCGGRLLLDAANGRVLHDDPTGAEPWPREPVSVDDHTVCLTPDARHIVLFDAVTDRELWTHTQEGFSTRSGEAPQVAVGPDALLLAEATNLGWRLQHLDRATGKPMWEQPPLLVTTDVDLRGWTLDAEAVCGVVDGVLFARSLKDGKRLWEQPLAGASGRWRTRRVGDLVLAIPAEGRAFQFQCRWLSGTVQWEEWSPPGREADGSWPAVFCDARTGRLVQRLNFAVHPTARLRLLPGESDALPRFEARSAPDVQAFGRGLVAAFGDRVWGLAAK